MNVRKSIIFALSSIFLSGFFISIYHPVKQYVFFATPVMNLVENEQMREIDIFYTTSLFRKIHYGKKQIPKYNILSSSGNIFLSDQYKSISQEYIGEEQMKLLIPIYCEKDIEFVKKNLIKLKKYNILSMKLEKNYQWSIEIFYKMKKIKIIFPFGNINEVYLEKLQKYYNILDNFSYIEILGENSIIASKS